MSTGRPTALLLNAGHALDHLFLLIFATAVGAIATDWGMIWQDLMPYTAGAFVMFGLGSLPAGRLGDLWGRRAAFAVPGGLALLCAVLFLLLVPREETAPAKRPRKSVDLPRAVMARVLGVMTLAAVSSSLIFNFTTNGNGQLLAERLRGLIDDPATLGVLLAVVYTIASLAVYLLGPTVKAAGFGTLLTVMAAISAFTTLCVALLPGRIPTGAPAPVIAAAAAPQR